MDQKSKQQLMKKKLLISLSLLLGVALSAQEYTVSPSSKVSVVGTSTIHDWESEVENVRGSATFEMENGMVISIPQMAITIKAESIESGKSKMNSITYESLKTKKFHNILFELSEVKQIAGNKVIVAGDLMISGMKRNVSVQGIVESEGNTITITGAKKIDMTEFDIEPPSAMFGAIQVGKDVNILFTLKLTN
ncbi:MAG: polyisoprenoid-binding protein YceI [Cryomorphaceae bacterium]